MVLGIGKQMVDAIIAKLMAWIFITYQIALKNKK